MISIDRDKYITFIMPKYVHLQTCQEIYHHGDDRLIVYAGDGLDSKSLDEVIVRFGNPDIIVGDVEGSVGELPAAFYFIPGMIMGMQNWSQKLRDITDLDNDFVTQGCFCWSVNRFAIDRYLMIKILEWFGLSAVYTWSGIGRSADCLVLFDEMDVIDADWFTQDFRSFLLSPISIPDNFVPEPMMTVGPSLVRLRHGTVSSQWQHVQRQLTKNTAVYLLTESTTDQHKHYTFTEKTGWALMGGNFPIWVGNYGQAYQASAMGIDIFSDVIDHEYQWKSTLIERCYHAIHDNVRMLKDIEFARNMRTLHRDRLLGNRQWYLGSGLQTFVDQQTSQLLDQGIDLRYFLNQ